MLSELCGPRLLNRRLLIVEDRYFVADDLSRLCARHGAEIVGVVANIEQARRLARSERLDLAILDVELRGEEVFAVAAILDGRGIPFVFVTGYPRTHLPERYRSRPLVSKPFSDGDLLAGIDAALQERRSVPDRG